MTMPTEEQIFSGWANGHRAHAAREAINAYWKAQLQPGEAAVSGGDPGEVHERLSRMTCALRHLADGIAGMSFPPRAYLSPCRLHPPERPGEPGRDCAPGGNGCASARCL